MDEIMSESSCLPLGVVEISFYQKTDLLERGGFQMNTFNYIEYNNYIYVVPTLVRESSNKK